MRILKKDLKKKKIEHNLKQQEYSDNIEKVIKNNEHEAIRMLNYEIINRPKYD